MAATILLDNDSSVPLIGSSLDEKKGDLKSRTVEELKERLKAIESNPDFKKFQDWNDTGVHYKDDFTCYRKTTSAAFSIIVIVAIGATIVALGLLFSNHFFSFPHDFMSFFQNVNYTKFALMGGIPLILVTGAGIVIYRAVTRQEKLHGKLEVTYIDLQTHEKKVVQIDSLTDHPKSTEEKPISIKKIKKIDDVSEAPERGEFRNVGDHLKTVLLKCQLDNARVSKRDA